MVKPGVYACLSRRRSRVRIPSSPQIGQIAQSVEHLSEKQGVGSSILPLATVNIFLKKVRSFKNRNYKAQGNLDKKLKKYLNFKEGFYIEIGANDGLHQSNTYYLEKKKKWTGLLIEPGSEAFSRLIKNRSSNNIMENVACVSFEYESDYIDFYDYYLMSFISNIDSDNDIKSHENIANQYIENTELEYSTYKVRAETLNSILLKHNAPKIIDFFSLDVEGEELSVLKGFDFNIFKIKYLLVESRNLLRMEEFLIQHNMKLVESFTGNYLFKLLK